MKSVATITLILSLAGSAVADEARQLQAREPRQAPAVLTASQLDSVTAGTTVQFNPESLSITRYATEESGGTSLGDDSSTWLRVEQINTDGSM